MKRVSAVDLETFLKRERRREEVGGLRRPLSTSSPLGREGLGVPEQRYSWRPDAFF